MARMGKKIGKNLEEHPADLQGAAGAICARANETTKRQKREGDSNKSQDGVENKRSSWENM